MSFLRVLLAACMLSLAAGSVIQGKNASEKTVQTETIRENFEAAADAALGHGHGAKSYQLQTIQERLSWTFRALPQNSLGRIELPALRIAVHRYFMQQYGISLRAFEPHRPVNTSELQAAEVLQDRAAAFVDELIRGRFANDGFSLADTVAMIATLEELISDDTTQRMERIFGRFKISVHDDVPQDIAGSLIQAMYAELEYGSLPEYWMSYPVLEHAISELKRVEYERFHSSGDNAFGKVFRKGHSFEEVALAAHRMVQGVSATMTDCRGLRAHLTELDSEGTGRVDLTRFYLSGNQKQYDFSESKNWLRQMGVLDESSSFRGPQVIISNYIGAASNCRLHTPLYRVCCAQQECESIMTEVEKSVGASTAEPSDILDVAKKLTDQPKVLGRAALTEKLDAIAQQHNGVVPLHGRLFSQWLHFAFPQACPFPHKRGRVFDQSLGECGKECLASAEEKEAVLEQDSRGVDSLPQIGDGTDDLDIWLQQWSHEEELVNGEMELSPRTPMRTYAKGAVVVLLLGLLLVGKGTSSGKKKASMLPTITTHCV